MLSYPVSAKISNNFVFPMEENTWENESRFGENSLEGSMLISIKTKGMWIEPV